MTRGGDSAASRGGARSKAVKKQNPRTVSSKEAAASPRAATKTANRRETREVPPRTPPQYDPAAVGRIAARVQIRNVELVHAFFERSDAGPLPRESPTDQVPEVLMDPRWELSDDGSTLGCLLKFATRLVSEDAPTYRLIAHFRLVYSLNGETPLDESDVEAFVFWNAVFNAWPYWREFLSSTVNRAGLPRFVLPVLGLPRPGDTVSSE